ncbi:MAG: DUF2283 domain-containing protein [Candidatus Methanoperedens sp.]|nr:DUF2283 domain-containing protein [Candidatus Methanoperedens sp.]
MSSVEVNGIIIDFSEKDNLVGLEILDASSKFQVSKSELLKIKHFDATININKENIIVSMKLVIEKRNQLFDRCLEATTINSMNLPSGTQEIAVTC